MLIPSENEDETVPDASLSRRVNANSQQDAGEVVVLKQAYQEG